MIFYMKKVNFSTVLVPIDSYLNVILIRFEGRKYEAKEKWENLMKSGKRSVRSIC